MNHDRSRGWLVRIRRLFRPTVLEIKPLRELEIQLNRGALEGPFQSIFDRDIYLGAVKRSIPRTNLPVSRVVLLKRFRELLLIHWVVRAQLGDLGY